MMRVLEHETRGYVWEDQDTGRQIRVSFLPKREAKLVLLEGRGANAVEEGTFTGDRDDAQLIGITWLHGMRPGSNRVAWRRNADRSASPKRKSKPVAKFA